MSWAPRRQRRFRSAGLVLTVAAAGWVTTTAQTRGLPAPAPTLPLPVNLRCEGPVREQLDRWGVTGEVFRDPAMDGRHTWRLPTDRLGTWVVLGFGGGAAPTLSRIHAGGTAQIRLGPSCEPAPVEQDRGRGPMGAFDDGDLAALLQDGRPGMVYVWSPHMPLSVDGYRHAARAAAALGIRLTALLDPAADPGYARRVAAAGGLPASSVRPFDSIELHFRNATLHAPSVLVYANGRPLGVAVPGYRDETGYRTLIERRLRHAGPSAPDRQ